MLDIIKKDKYAKTALIYFVFCYVIVNLPLLRIMQTHSFEMQSVLSVIKFSPHQFLFLVLFFPIGLFTLLCALLILIDVTKSDQVQHKKFKKTFFVFALVLIFILSLVNLALNETIKINDIYKLNSSVSVNIATLAETTAGEVNNLKKLNTQLRDNAGLRTLASLCCTFPENSESLSKHVFEQISNDLKSRYKTDEAVRIKLEGFFVRLNGITQKLSAVDLDEEINNYIQEHYNGQLHNLEFRLRVLSYLYSKELTTSDYAESIGDPLLNLFDAIESIFSVSTILLLFFLSYWLVLQGKNTPSLEGNEPARKKIFSLCYISIIVSLVYCISRLYSVQTTNIIDLADAKSGLDAIAALVVALIAGTWVARFILKNGLIDKAVGILPIIISISGAAFALWDSDKLDTFIGHQMDNQAIVLLIVILLVFILWVTLALKKNAE